MDQDPLLTPEEVADYLKVPLNTVWLWCRQGTLPAVKFGKYWRISRTKLLAAVENGAPTVPPSTREARHG